VAAPISAQDETRLEQLFRLVDAARDEIIRLEQDLVRVETVNTGTVESGQETPACSVLADYLGDDDVASETHESAPGRGNLIARLAGAGEGPSLLLMSHLDVVPVENADKWVAPPFSGALIDDKIYGRGSDDAKSLAVVEAMAIKILKRAGLQPRGDVIFLAAADEESGGKYGAGWVASNLASKIRADYAINEGGGSPLTTPGGLAYAFCTGEKGRLEVRVEVHGRSSHAARPWASDNALVKLSEVVRRIAAYRPELDFSHPVFREIPELFGLSETPGPENVERLYEELKPHSETAASLLRATSRMTLTPTMARAGIKSNSIPEIAHLTCDVRSLPHQDDGYVRRQVESLVQDIPGVRVEVDYTAEPNASPYDDPFVEQCQVALRQAIGQDVRLLPALTAGFTDSRFLRPLGTKVYGFMPIPPNVDTTRSGVHGMNEYIEVETLLMRTRFLLALIVGSVGVVEFVKH
jgi:acetylornithine deacetylase/succinyl-diaminopimelate desuccinylase-like protein